MILILPTCGHAQDQNDRASESWGDLYGALASDKMPCRLMKPWEFNAKQNYPLIVSLHDSGGKGTDNKKQLKGWNRQLAEKQNRTEHPCYVLAP